MTALRPVNSGERNLYGLGGVAALMFVAYSLATMILLVTLGGQPQTALEAFTLLRNNRLVGLVRLDVLTILVMPLYYLLFLCLYAALKPTHRTYDLLAYVLVAAGVTLFLATPSAFTWLALSDKFAVAASDAQRTLLLAAGEATLASDLWHGSGALVGGLLIQIGALLLSVMMLRSPAFARATAYVGLVTHGLDLAHLILGFFIPAGGVVLLAIAGPLYLVWFPLLARDLFRLGRAGGEQ